MTTINPTTGELFDQQQYAVPFPRADGHQVTDLQLRLGGTLKLNRHDPDHATLLESFRLGQMRTLTIVCSVDGKAQTKKEDADGNDVVTHTVALKIHEVSEDA